MVSMVGPTNQQEGKPTDWSGNIMQNLNQFYRLAPNYIKITKNTFFIENNSDIFETIGKSIWFMLPTVYIV